MHAEQVGGWFSQGQTTARRVVLLRCSAQTQHVVLDMSLGFW